MPSCLFTWTERSVWKCTLGRLTYIPEMCNRGFSEKNKKKDVEESKKDGEEKSNAVKVPSNHETGKARLDDGPSTSSDIHVKSVSSETAKKTDGRDNFPLSSRRSTEVESTQTSKSLLDSRVKSDSELDSRRTVQETKSNCENKGGKSTSKSVEKFYTIDDVVNEGGFGKFQVLVTFITGMSWFSFGGQISAFSFIGDFLPCERTLYNWQIAVIRITMFLGMIVSSPLFGILSDRHGRRKAIALSNLMAFIVCGAGSLSNNVVALTVMAGLLGFSLGGSGQPLTLASEYYSAKHRGLSSFIIQIFFACGNIASLLVSWVITHFLFNWKWYLVVVSLPSLATFLLIPWFPESARFCLVNDQRRRAAGQLKLLAHMNKMEKPEGRLKPLPKEDRGKLTGLLKRITGYPPH
ncbi:hypothetical protein CEXT_712291 [Caerostris extrusa]|uniref:Major facilitator superfamily (MFS) profile domain-containing protein n=1 Tax=Caerostris extrusa TaxID=172846 RepID=A0AAV4NP04_CAEEX|nr:hypothetical protein CEXT_712291 [Caerostris extrusa]